MLDDTMQKGILEASQITQQQQQHQQQQPEAEDCCVCQFIGCNITAGKAIASCCASRMHGGMQMMKKELV